VKMLLRLSLPVLALVLIAPVQASAAKKRSYSNLGGRTLEQGDRGKDVKILQKYLNRAGHTADVDGVYGKDTKGAVVAFETAQGRKADGRFSRTDAQVLRDVVANGSAIGSGANTGGTAPTEEQVRRVGPGAKAIVGPDGLATAPAVAPQPIKDIIAAGNRIASRPYIYGGGHGKWEDAGYDCSGSVSYALHGANLLQQAMPSGSFTSWGDAGPGQWVTIYANGGHMYMVVAGLRFDTSGRTKNGTRWQADMRSGGGYTVRHPEGL
jgi:peptidoglycan hydrolase-like protein with peptidoglycan-binding domain